MNTQSHTSRPIQALRHHVSGAIARGESAPVVEVAEPAKPTPGPWTVDYGGPAHLGIEDNAGRVLAFCNLQCEDGDEDEANARLIAAAPDLLSVLQVIAADGNRDGWIPSYHWREALQAIAKTEGGQQ